MQRPPDRIDVWQCRARRGDDAHTARGQSLLGPGSDGKADSGVRDRCRHGGPWLGGAACRMYKQLGVRTYVSNPGAPYLVAQGQIALAD